MKRLTRSVQRSNVEVPKRPTLGRGTKWVPLGLRVSYPGGTISVSERHRFDPEPGRLSRGSPGVSDGETTPFSARTPRPPSVFPLGRDSVRRLLPRPRVVPTPSETGVGRRVGGREERTSSTRGLIGSTRDRDPQPATPRQTSRHFTLIVFGRDPDTLVPRVLFTTDDSPFRSGFSNV